MNEDELGVGTQDVGQPQYEPEPEPEVEAATVAGPPPVMTEDEIDQRAIARLQQRKPELFQQAQRQPIQQTEEELEYDPGKIKSAAVNESVATYQLIRSREKEVEAMLSKYPQEVKDEAVAALHQMGITALQNPGAVELAARHAVGGAEIKGKLTPRNPLPDASPVNTRVPDNSGLNKAQQRELDAFNGRQANPKLRMTAKEYLEEMTNG